MLCEGEGTYLEEMRFASSWIWLGPSKVAGKAALAPNIFDKCMFESSLVFLWLLWGEAKVLAV